LRQVHTSHTGLLSGIKVLNGPLGSTLTRPDPMTYDMDNLLGKYVHSADSGRRDRVTLGLSRRHVQTNSLSALVPGSFPAYYRAQDTATRFRASVGQQFTQLKSGLADSLD